MIHFDLPKDKSSIIKVIGVGGGGSNAVNQMFSQGIDGVNFIICNTDAQAIAQSSVPNKVQLGPLLTQGLGAGANPDVGRQATEESLEEIKKILEVNTKMVFITAGMGGGTGTGGAPIVSKICKELGILTVGIVTTPFSYEGRKRMQQAEAGINLLKEQVDTLLVINNDKLRHQYGNLKMSEAFEKADNILATAAKCITDVITGTGQINVDFADVCTVMRNGGVAILGNASVAGENRAQIAIEEALNSPLLNDNNIKGAKWILLNINSAEGEFEHTMDEVEIIQNFIIENAGEDTDVILGLGFDSSLNDKIAITMIATGFEQKNPFEKPKVELPKPEKIIMTLQTNNLQKTTNEQPVIEEKVEEIKEEKVDVLAPQLIEQPEEKKLISIISPSVLNNVEQTKIQPIVEKFELKNEITETPIKSFLAKPSNLYNQNIEVQETKNEVIPNAIELSIDPINVENKVEDSYTENNEMELVLKNDVVSNETNVVIEQLDNQFVEAENGENDSLTKAAERTKKLRNLSFNFNTSDADEYENQPAYLRRKEVIHNSLTNVEKFYSNYTVSVNANNESQINPNSKNTFLEGEKPD